MTSIATFYTVRYQLWYNSKNVERKTTEKFKQTENKTTSKTVFGRLENGEYVYSVVVYQKYLTRLGELIIFEHLRENYHFPKPSKIFLIYDSTMYVFYLSFNV